jgi:hypothetical protein
MKTFFLFFSFSAILLAAINAIDIMPIDVKKSLPHIKILDQKELSFTRIQGVKFAELSDAAYDAKKKQLYFVSDKGILYQFHASFSEKIDRLESIRAVKLKTKKGLRFKKWKRDSEGLVLDAQGRLYISFEGKAKVARFHKTGKKFAQLIRKEKIPKVLRPTSSYRSKNKSLEALAWHKKYGLLTATEWPLKKDDKKRQTIYTLNGKQWHFKAEPEARSSVVAMEVMDDGNVLVLERSYAGLLSPFVITLKKVYLQEQKHGWCKTKILAKMNSHEGWMLDNFEGLTKIAKNRYLMVSDDNENFFQKTLLIYFEVTE